MNKFLNTIVCNKGQALVEFVLILPIFIFLLFSIYDFGMIFNRKNSLESSSTDIIELYKTGKTIDEINGLYTNLTINMESDDKYDKIVVEDKVKLITPGFNRIFGNPYKIQVVRYIANE